MSAAPTIFTAHAVTDGPTDSLRLVPHRFSWAAFWFGALWAMRHRLWRVTAAALVFDVGMLIALRSGVFASGAAFALWFVAAVVMGLEGEEWRRRALIRRGAALAGFEYGLDEGDVLAQIAFRERSKARQEATP